MRKASAALWQLGDIAQRHHVHQALLERIFKRDPQVHSHQFCLGKLDLPFLYSLASYLCACKDLPSNKKAPNADATA
jgi:hypothetical protein